MRPPSDIADPVQWRPREFNKRADYLCNLALDTQASCSFVAPDVSSYCITDVQWECFSDGARRGDGYSSFSWLVDAVWAIHQERHRFTVAFGYDFLEGNFSSFQTEMWGLERAMGVLKSLRS